MSVSSSLVNSPALSIDVSVELSVPASQAWRLIHDFGRVEDWHPVVAKTHITRGIGNAPGAVRHLTFLDGATLEEELTAYSPEAMQLQYIITAGEFPVRNYRTTLSVEAVSSQRSRVRWVGTFDRADPGIRPAKGKDDDAAMEAVRGVYTTGLNALVELAENIRGIEQTIGFYERGGTEGLRDVAAEAFHSSASMKFMRHGTLVDVPIAQFFSDYISAGVRQERELYIDSIDVKDTAASARVTIDYATHQFVDFFNLLKIEGRWLIVSKIFHRVEKLKLPSEL